MSTTKRFSLLLLALCAFALPAHADLVLRQATASQAVLIGPFVDSTDGNTAETALTIDAADVRLSANGGNIAAKNSGGCTHDELGYYACTLDATDTATVGRLQLAVHESGALPVYHEYNVLEEATYDITYASSATGLVTANVMQISGDSAAADALETAYDESAGPVPQHGITDQGTAQSATSTTLVLRAATPFGADDAPIGSTLWAFGSTQGYWQSQPITDYVTSTDTATVDGWVVTPSGTITYKVHGTAPGSSGSGLDAAGVRAAVGLASANLDTQLSTIEGQTDDIGVAGAGLTNIDLPNQTMSITGNITGNVSGSVGSVTGAVGSVAGNVGGTVNGLTVTAQGDVETAAAAALTAYDPPTAAELTSALSALNDLSTTDIRSIVIEDQGAGVSLGCAIAVLLSYAAGDLTTDAGTSTYEDPSGTETRVTGSVTTPGNRTATITCPTY